MAGIAPIQYQWTVYTPYWAPLAAMPRISVAPRLAATKARPVTQAGSERPARKKSRLVRTDRRAAQPTPRTTAK
ncbi:hypothetical protein GCM10020221_01100 [Streptomyces thioluteus]|uniref:Uncharacterized protein n=1 Tax=Streptomyces thioluteus TaxID=66431 RepID=A0ABN3WAH3_STRTU